MDAGLGERLEAYSNAVREFIPAYAEAVDQLVSRLSSSGAGLEAHGRASRCLHSSCPTREGA